MSQKKLTYKSWQEDYSKINIKQQIFNQNKIQIQIINYQVQQICPKEHQQRKQKNDQQKQQLFKMKLQNNQKQQKQTKTFDFYFQSILKKYKFQLYFNLSQYSIKLIFTLYIFLLLFPLCSSYCQRTNTNLNENKKYDIIQMCFISFPQKIYLVSCRRKYNCTQIINKSSNQNFQKSQSDQLNTNQNQNINEFGQKKITNPESNLIKQTSIFSYSSQKCQTETPQITSSAKCEELNCQIILDRFKYSQNNNSITLKVNQKKSYEYCKEYINLNKSDSNFKIIVIITIILSVLICIFSIAWIFKKWKERNNEQTDGNYQGTGQSHVQSYIKQSQIHLQNFNLQNFGPYNIEQKLTQSCSICLQSHCNLYTKCGHFYHPNCLRQWLVKRAKCPVCLSKQYNPVKIYCSIDSSKQDSQNKEKIIKQIKGCGMGDKFQILNRTQLNQQEIIYFSGLNHWKCRGCLIQTTRKNIKSNNYIQKGEQQIMKQQKNTFKNNSKKYLINQQPKLNLSFSQNVKQNQQQQIKTKQLNKSFHIKPNERIHLDNKYQYNYQNSSFEVVENGIKQIKYYRQKDNKQDQFEEQEVINQQNKVSKKQIQQYINSLRKIKESKFSDNKIKQYIKQQSNEQIISTNDQIRQQNKVFQDENQPQSAFRLR